MDNTSTFERLWGITTQLKHKLETRFELNLDPSTASLQKYKSSNGNIQGTLQGFSGEEIDWLVHSHLRNFGQSQFSVMRLTVWLGSHIQVPHLAFEFGTMPHILFYMDYIPRTELISDLDYLDRYYEPINQTYLSLQANPNLSLFTSKSLYIRLFQSPISLCYTCQPSDDTINLIETLANEMLERWLRWIDEAEPVPEEARTVLAKRDLFMRRKSAERDPDNKLAAQMLGQELTDKLVRSLWGGECDKFHRLS